jgi:hypothetical protein
MSKHIGIITGGGDCPGLNAVIRAVAKAAAMRGCETLGIRGGYEGLLEPRQPMSTRTRTKAALSKFSLMNAPVSSFLRPFLCRGIAPGYKGSLSWWKLSLYSEGEYVFDTGNSSHSFLYNWSELTLAPVEWFRFGLVTQRTRVYETDREIQRGVLAGFTYKKASLTAYVLNPDESQPTVAVAVGLNF